MLFSTTFADTVIQEITGDSQEPQDSEEWQRAVATGLASLPEASKGRAGQWLVSGGMKHANLLLKWLADPQTADAGMGAGRQLRG